MREAGRSVPADVSVLGYDNAPEALYFDPPLTALTQDFWAPGVCAFSLLAEQMGIQATGPTRPYLPEPELIVRGSTAPSRGGLGSGGPGR